MKNRYIKIGIFILVALLILLFTADMSPLRHDILSQKVSGKGKIQITVCVNGDINLDTLERLAEEKFSNLDLIQISSFASDKLRENDLRFLHDDLGDIIITKYIDANTKSGNGRLMDLSQLPLVSTYSSHSLQSLYDAENLYFLPGPGKIRGIVYNKTLFEQHSWLEPKSFTRLVEVSRDIINANIKPIHLYSENKQDLQNIFIDTISSHSNQDKSLSLAIEEYKSSNGSFSDISSTALKDIFALQRADAFSISDFDSSAATAVQSLFSRSSAMVIGGIDIISLAREQGITDELSIMPFYSMADNIGWHSLCPDVYIALNKHLESASNDKQSLAIDLLTFLSSIEGQRAISSNNHSFVSPVTNINPLWDIPLLFQDEKTELRVAQPVFSENVYNELYNVAHNILTDNQSLDAAFQSLDELNKLPPQRHESQLLGEARTTFSVAQTGSYIADTVRMALGTQFALILDSGKDGTYNAKGVSGKIYSGKIYESDIINRVLPPIQGDMTGGVDVITVTGAGLLDILENSIADGNWFYYFSGMKVTINPSAEKGQRIKKLTDRYGDSLDPDKIYVVAVLEDTVDEKYTVTYDKYPMLIQNYIINDIKENGKISPPTDRRLRIVKY